MRRNFIKGLASAGLGVVGYGASAALGIGCDVDEEGNSTTGKRVALGTQAVLASGTTFENPAGWTFTLEKVTMSIAALYYFSGEPIEPLASAPRRDSLFKVVQRVLVPEAHAHPGHYKNGAARGEMLEASSFDLVATPLVALPAGAGITGLVRSARVVFGDLPVGAQALALGSALIAVEVTATKGELTRHVRLEASKSDVLDADLQPRVEGCVFGEVELEESGLVTLSIDPRVWLDQCELDDAPEGTASAPTLLDESHVGHRAFVRGIKKSTAFTLAYTQE